MECFETRSIVNIDTFLRELRWKSKPPREKIRVAIGSIACLVVAIVGIISQNATTATLGFAGAIVIPLIYIRQFSYVTKVNFARIQESTGKADIEQITSFTDDKVKVQNNNTGGTTYLNYDRIVRFAETKSSYVLFTKENQAIYVNKINLMQEQKSEAFLRFIQDKCKKIKWGK